MDHIVFKNKNKKTLVFYPVPKNANTSVKTLFASILGIEDKFIDQGTRSELLAECGLTADNIIATIKNG